MRKPVIAANWKMYKTPTEAQQFMKVFLPLVAHHERDEILIFPSITSLSVVITAAAGSNVEVGAQNIHYAEEGPYTGETSAPMIKAIGATHVIIGHSERRQYFCETDEIVNQKLHAAIEYGLTPVLCIGENLEEREHGKTEVVLLRQSQKALKGVIPKIAESFLVAYTPIWATGTGKTADPEVVGMAHFLIRSEIARLLGRKAAESVRILYGGSVNAGNASTFLNQPEIDGVLVGGASLDPQTFANIVKH